MPKKLLKLIFGTIIIIFILMITTRSVKCVPVADAGNDITIPFYETIVMLDGSQSYDTNGCNLTYSWTRMFEGGIIESSTEECPTMFIKNPGGYYEYELVVTNECGTSDTDTMMVWKNLTYISSSNRRYKTDPNAPVDCKDKLECDPNDICYDPNHPEFYLCDPNYVDDKCKDKLECDPNDICYDPNHPDLHLCDPNYIDCKDKLECDPDKDCYDPNHSDFWTCDPNIACKGRLECDPTKKCYDPNSPIHWMCFYEDPNKAHCDPNLPICYRYDSCYNPDHPEMYWCPDPNHVTAVDLFSFTATGDGDVVVIEWVTAQEVDNLGFRIYRSLNRDGPYEAITKMIPASNMGVMGASYSYIDSDVYPYVPYYYKLEDIETTGQLTQHGPIGIDWDNDGEEDCINCPCRDKEIGQTESDDLHLPVSYSEFAEDEEEESDDLETVIEELIKDQGCFINLLKGDKNE